MKFSRSANYYKNMSKYFFNFILAAFFFIISFTHCFSENIISIGRLKYGGGGDWYADPTAIPNVIAYLNKNSNIKSGSEIIVTADKKDLIKTPFIFITGHGNIKLEKNEINNLREFIVNGGFIYIDDCYGLDKSARELFKLILPESKLTEITASHKIYHSLFDFPNGLPKIHEHDNQPAQGFGLFWEGRLALFYSYESDIGCGCEDEWVHNNPKETREKALKMFCNIIAFNLLYN